MNFLMIKILFRAKYFKYISYQNSIFQYTKLKNIFKDYTYQIKIKIDKVILKNLWIL